MHWLITGGCGFIGTNLIKSLLTKKNQAVTVVDDLSSTTSDCLHGLGDFQEVSAEDVKQRRASRLNGNRLIVGDICDHLLAIEAGKNADIIVHLAANSGIMQSIENPLADCRTNILGTLNYLESAKINRAKRFILASSSAPLGKTPPPVDEHSLPQPLSPYGSSKLAAEAYCSSYFHSYGVEAVALRFSNVYGPNSTHKNSVVAKFIKAALSGDTFTVYGDGQQTRDFIHVDDLVAAIIQAASVEKIGGEIFHISSGLETSLNSLMEKLIVILKKNGVNNMQIEAMASRAGEIQRASTLNAKARTQLKWQPKHDLDGGLTNTVDWFLAQQ